MLAPLKSKLASSYIVLASSSPRRIKLLESIGFPFQCTPSTFEENLDPKAFPQVQNFVIETAKEKALDVAKKISKTNDKIPDLVIGADTIVTFENEIFGKPKTEDDAFNMLTKLSGKSHTVYTGVVFVTPKADSKDFTVKSFYEVTTVTMSVLKPEIIQDYIKSGEPMDKAGSYGIQGLGGSLIESIQGDYYNVTGFPLNRFCKELTVLLQ